MKSAEQLVTLMMSEAPGVIRETIRRQFSSHRMVVAHIVDAKSGELAVITPERWERLLQDVANNVAQALYSIEKDPA